MVEGAPPGSGSSCCLAVPNKICSGGVSPRAGGKNCCTSRARSGFCSPRGIGVCESGSGFGASPGATLRIGCGEPRKGAGAFRSGYIGSSNLPKSGARGFCNRAGSCREKSKAAAKGMGFPTMACICCPDSTTGFSTAGSLCGAESGTGLRGNAEVSFGSAWGTSPRARNCFKSKNTAFCTSCSLTSSGSFIHPFPMSWTRKESSNNLRWYGKDGFIRSTTFFARFATSTGCSLRSCSTILREISRKSETVRSNWIRCFSGKDSKICSTPRDTSKGKAAEKTSRSLACMLGKTGCPASFASPEPKTTCTKSPICTLPGFFTSTRYTFSPTMISRRVPDLPTTFPVLPEAGSPEEGVFPNGMWTAFSSMESHLFLFSSYRTGRVGVEWQKITRRVARAPAGNVGDPSFASGNESPTRLRNPC